MQKNILWAGIEYHSLENCILTVTDRGSRINSTIVGTYDNIFYKVEYQIETNHFWETTLVEIKSQLNDKIETISFQSTGNGSWTANGKPLEIFTGCIDIDIPLTPMTNTLPINRLKLAEKQENQIKVLYIDILNHQTTSVQQKYKRLSQNEYKYENVPNDFEATITIDECGLVVMYPELFTRTLIKESNYR